MKIAHISDLHIDYKDKSLIDEFEKIIRNIYKTKVEHLIITGDLIHNPFVQNYEVIKRILNKYEFWNYERLTVTIGNHEVFGGAEKTHTFPYQCKYTNYNEKVQEFIIFFKRILSNNKYSSFPIFKEISGNIVLIIFNSVAHWSANRNPIGSNGNVDAKQLEKAGRILSSGKYDRYFKIAVIHHHFYYTANRTYDEMHRLWLYSERDTMVMHNWQKVLSLLKRNKINLILHGHTHYTNTYKKGNIKIINSSGCLKPLSQKKKKLYTMLELNEKNKKLKLNIRFIEN